MQEIRGAKKFRHVSIEPSLKNTFDRMYSNIVATGAFAWAPSSDVPAGSGVDPGTSNADIADDGLEEGSGDSEEDVIPDFQTDMARMVGGIHMSSSTNTKSGEKRKERDHYDVRGRKKKTSGIGVKLLTRCNHLLESMSTKMIRRLLIWIVKAVAFPRSWLSCTPFLEFQLTMIFMTSLRSILV